MHLSDIGSDLLEGAVVFSPHFLPLLCYRALLVDLILGCISPFGDSCDAGVDGGMCCGCFV